MRRKAITQIHSDNPCSTGGCEGTGKGPCVKQPPNQDKNYEKVKTKTKKFKFTMCWS